MDAPQLCCGVLHFSEVFHEKKGFDVVIANPPYVRQEALGSELKTFFSKKYSEVYNGIADLYVYFYAISIQILKKNGCLAFITPNKWMERKYGLELRQFLKKYDIKNIIIYGELKVFEGSTPETEVTILRKVISEREIEYVSIRSLDEAHNSEGYKFKKYKKTNLDDTIWRFLDSETQTILEKFRAKTISLTEYTKNGIFYGIKTGLNRAFIVDHKIRDQLIEEDPQSAKILKKMVEGDDFGKWYLRHSGRYMITTEYDLDIPKYYPAIYGYLKQYEKELINRQDQGQNYWNLRACTYYEEFEKPKIIYYHTALKHEFYLYTQGYYISANCYLIANADRYLQCVLNSSLFDFGKKYKFPAFGDVENRGRIRLDANKMIKLPIRIISKTDQQPFNDLVDRILSISQSDDYLGNFGKQAKVKEYEKQIDQMVYQLYGLTKEEIQIVEGD